MTESVFIQKITAACYKKISLLEESLGRYAIRAIFGGASLALTIWVGALAADAINAVHPALSKFFFAFIFAWGLAYILFLNAELATSNMMFLTAGVYLKKIKFSKAMKVLLTCTFFNLIGAAIIGWLANQSGNLGYMNEGSFLIKGVGARLANSSSNIFFGAIAANTFVNIAIISVVLLKEESVKLPLIISCVFMFVYLGIDHVVANFGQFTIVGFSKAVNLVKDYTILNTIRQWGFSFLGNFVGAGLILGIAYSYFNKTKTNYKD